jgi:hypothetical protein
VQLCSSTEVSDVVCKYYQNTDHSEYNQIVISIKLTMTEACGQKSKTYKKNIEKGKYDCPNQKVDSLLGSRRHRKLNHVGIGIEMERVIFVHCTWLLMSFRR